MLASTLALLLIVPCPPETEDWDAVATEYEKAFEAWAQERMRTGAWETEEGRADPGPAVLFLERFTRLAEAGDGRAVTWLLQASHGEGDERAARQRAAFAFLRDAGDADWVAPALATLPDLADALGHEELEHFLAERAGPEHPVPVRAGALLAHALLVPATEAARADSLRLSAALLRWPAGEGASAETLTASQAEVVAVAGLAAVESEQNAWFGTSLFEGSDGAYYPRASYVLDPRSVWEPVFEALARRGSAAACAHELFEGGGGPEALAKRRSFFELLVKAPLDAATRKELGSNLKRLIRELGPAFVEERLGPVIAAAPEAERAGLLFGLGDGLCDAGDAGALTRGLALLREVAEGWPDLREGQRALGRIFRYTNLVIGKQVPDFEAEDVDGHAFKLSDYEGKVTVIDFWGFW